VATVRSKTVVWAGRKDEKKQIDKKPKMACFLFTTLPFIGPKALRKDGENAAPVFPLIIEAFPGKAFWGKIPKS
jgi:hypothetical protein